VTLPAAGLEFWSPEHPKLYRVTLAADGDKLEDEMGFRTIETDGTKYCSTGSRFFCAAFRFTLKRPYPRRPRQQRQRRCTLLGWARELGCNYVRLVHYPHDERMTRAATAWNSSVVGNPCVLGGTLRRSRSAQEGPATTREEIARDRDKASIILWSIANETPATAARTQFLETLAGNVRALDSTRLVTAALLVRTEGKDKFIEDPLAHRSM